MQKFSKSESRVRPYAFHVLLRFGLSFLFATLFSSCSGKGDELETIRGGDHAQSAGSVLYGNLPTTITARDAREAYDEWREIDVEECDASVFRVRWDSARSDATVSQGIGHGLLLTVAHGDREVFDGLWQYYQMAMNGRGLMHWLRHGCDAHRETTYNDYPDDSASDADLDVAMGLLLADLKWGGEEYAASARALLAAIRQNEIIVEEERTVLLPGDNSWFVGMGGGCVNPSYSAPAYYRAFADFESEEANRELWRSLLSDTYSWLSASQHPETGLVRNFTDALGQSADCASSFDCADNFAGDAVRTSFRVATDYLWYGRPEAKEFLDKITTWVREDVGIEQLQVNYTLDGEIGSCESQGDRITSVGSLANGAVSFDEETANEFALELKNLVAGDTSARTLKALYLLQLSGQLTMGARSNSSD